MTTDKKPRVSIVLPVYNGSGLIGRQVDSILAQSFGDFQLFIIDNASEDRTEAVCRQYQARDPRIIYLRNPKNMGLNFSYKRGYYLSADSDFIIYASHNDYWHPEYLAECVKALDKNPKAVLAYSHVKLIAADGGKDSDYSDDFDLSGPDMADRYLKVIGQMGLCNCFYGLIRMRYYLEREPLLHSGCMAGDNLILAALSLLGPFIQIPRPLFFRSMPMNRPADVAEDARRLSTMAAPAPRMSTPPLPFLAFLHYHCMVLIYSNIQIPPEQKEFLIRQTIAILFRRYSAPLTDELNHFIDLISTGSLHIDPSGRQHGAEGLPRQGQYKVLDFLALYNIEQMLDMAQAFHRKFPRLNHARALILVMQSRKDEAIPFLDRELEIDPTYRPALELKAMLNRPAATLQNSEVTE